MTETQRTTKPTTTIQPTFTTTRYRTRTTRPPPTTIRGIEIIKISNRTRKPSRTTTEAAPITTSHLPSIIVAGHPQDNEIAGSSNIQHGEVPNVNIPLSVDGERRETFGARLNVGAIIALGAFGGFVFLAAIITTIVILVRR